MPYKDKKDLYKNQIDRWINIKKKAIEYKGSCCALCNSQYPYFVFDFHHRDPASKDASWTKLRLKSWDKIIHELDKCDLLCANCHRITHYS